MSSEKLGAESSGHNGTSPGREDQDSKPPVEQKAKCKEIIKKKKKGGRRSNYLEGTCVFPEFCLVSHSLFPTLEIEAPSPKKGPGGDPGLGRT